MRSAGLVFGTTVHITATVLACYFAGLGLGSAWARRVSSRPVRLYGCLELGAAAGAIWSLAIFWLLTHDAAQVWLSTAGNPGRVAAIALATLPTTLCLGATLPTLGQALASVDTIERRGGLLYAVNTLGGVLGAAAAGFGLPALVGVRASYGIAAGASMAAGLIAIMIGDRQETTPVKKLPLRNETSSAQLGRLRLVAAGTGAIGLGLEVLWTHLFAQVLHNSVYSFTAIVLVFLLAIAMRRGTRGACAASCRAVYRSGNRVGGRSGCDYRRALAFCLLDGWAHLLRHAHWVVGISRTDHNFGRCDCRPCRYRVGNGFACAVGRMG